MRTPILIALLFCLSVEAKLKVGLVLDKGGRDDKSFNAAAYKGAKEAESRLPFSLKVVESSDDTAIEPSIRTFAQHNYDLIIGIGFVMQSPLEKVAKQFPKTHFLLIDSPADLPNVRSVVFKEHEGSFVVGAIAALTSKTKSVGFVGGMDIPLIRRFELGYRHGVMSIDPKARVVTNYVGASSDAWRNPTKAKELAFSQYSKGVDIIYVAAGASGQGVFDAAEEKNKLAIGVDSNQNWVKPGKILTSMTKRVDLAVSQTIELEIQGKFAAGQFEIGIQEGAIDYALDEHNRAVLTPAVEKQANEIKAKIVAGKIQVPDYYKIKRVKK